MVPLAGIEPALLAELDFESSASTNSATGAFPGSGKRADHSRGRPPVNRSSRKFTSIRRGAWDKPPASARSCAARRAAASRSGPAPGLDIPRTSFPCRLARRWPACAPPPVRYYGRNGDLAPDMHEIVGSGLARPARRRHRQLAGQHIEIFVLRKVDVRRRPAAGRNEKIRG